MSPQDLRRAGHLPPRRLRRAPRRGRLPVRQRLRIRRRQGYFALRSRDHRGLPHGFKPTGEAAGVTHTFIPPSAHTYQSDVETVHRLCEDEFFDRESFRDRHHFLQKAQSYWLYFNVARRNSFKQDRCPLEMLRELTPHVNPRITIWQSAFLEDHLHMLLPKEIQYLRGKDLPVHP